MPFRSPISPDIASAADALGGMVAFGLPALYASRVLPRPLPIWQFTHHWVEWTSRCVCSVVVCCGSQAQIGGLIVKRVVVDMVNMFSRQQRSAQQLRHDDAMFVTPSICSHDHTIRVTRQLDSSKSLGAHGRAEFGFRFLRPWIPGWLADAFGNLSSESFSLLLNGYSWAGRSFFEPRVAGRHGRSV